MQQMTLGLRQRRGRIFIRILAACAITAAALAAARAPAQTIVTQTVTSETGSTQTNVPVTFGQVFKDGDVPKGRTVTATVNGRSVPLQVNAKATHPDGSLRHAVLTAMIPSLAGKSTLPLAIASAPGTADNHSAQPVTLAHLLATPYDAKASFTAKGATYTVDARKLLQQALDQHSCKAWGKQCNVWLQGPLTSAWVVSQTVPAPDDAPVSHLRVFFAVRAYAGNSPGTVDHVRTDVIVENSDAFAPQAQPQYTAALTSGSASYESPALTQYTATRWHHALWWNQKKPAVYLRQDTQYIQASKAISRYMKLKPTEKFLADRRQSCKPLKRCDQTRHMGAQGAQDAIGPLPRWTSVYIIDPDVRAYRWMLADTDALGAYSMHYRDAATGWPVSIAKHPYVTILNWAAAHRAASRHNARGRKFKADLLHNCVKNAVIKKCSGAWYSTGNPYRWNSAHQPAESYVPYMVTGDYYYMSELAFGTSYNDLEPNQGYRGGAKGLDVRAHNPMRGKAWTLRNMVESAWLLPDDYPLKHEFNQHVHNTLKDLNKAYTNNPQATPLRFTRKSAVYKLHSKKRNAIAPWQHNFLTWSAGHAADLGFDGAADFRDWLAQFEISLMTDWQDDPTHGYCWLEASAYKIQVKDAAGKSLPSFTAVYAGSFPKLVGLECNSSAMVKAMGKLKKKHWKKGKMPGYPYSATGFPANFQIGLAAAADSKVPKAHEAWTLFESRSVKPRPPKGYNNFPNFAVLPRTVEH